MKIKLFILIKLWKMGDACIKPFRLKKNNDYKTLSFLKTKNFNHTISKI